MLIDLVLLLLGGVGLYYGADWLVDGAAGIARSLGVPALVVGLTIVSYGTSAPELVVSLVAAFEGRSAISLGNVIGSNIANIGLILGVTACIAPPLVPGSLVRRELPFLVVASLALPFVMSDAIIGRVEGVIFVVGAIGFTYATFKWVADSPEQEEGEDDEQPKLGPQAVWLTIGLVVLLAGGKSFVEGASGIAHGLGMSDRLVGLTVVAIGTSLPELAASLAAALKGHSDLAVGNVVGSNLFNILLVLGATSLVRPIEGSLASFARDLSFMGALTLLCVLSMHRERRVGRVEGGIYLLGYAGFLSALAL